LAFIAGGAFAAEPAPDQLEFFEKKIRPVFAEHCYKCHSAQAEKLKGGLLLDTKVALLKGGDTGPAIVAGNPDASLLIKAVRYGDENLQMPPIKGGGKKLAPEKIADLEAWVKMGAPDPRTNSAAATNAFELVIAKGRQHWAFQPIRKPDVPAVGNPRWAQTPIDSFVLAKLEGLSLGPSPRADKRTLIRRAYYDLIGLPPTPAEVEAFLADRSPEAFAKVVDRLLASPHYGERWGRHWLDVARYADTKGYVGGSEELRYAYAYTYRDYVIRAFNDDLPYDRFLTEQLAADLLPLGADNRPLAALGFLTLGRRFINNEQDIIDDRLDVICRGLMGVTIQCARCHDHKFDPVPTRDYYSLYGVFRSSTEPGEKPLLANQPPNPEYDKYISEQKRRQAAHDDYVGTNTLAVQTKLREQVGDYLLLAHQTSKLTNEVDRENLLRDRKLNKVVRDRWINGLTAWAKTNHPVFGPSFAFAAVTNDFPAKAKELSAKFAANSDPTNKLNPLVAKLFTGDPPATVTNVVERYGKLLRGAHDHWQQLLNPTNIATATNTVAVTNVARTNPPPAALPDPAEEELRQILYAKDAPANPPAASFGDYFLFDDTIKNKIQELKNAIAALDVTHPGAPARAMAMQDKPKPENVRVFVRGNAGTPGPEAPRQFLEIAAGAKRASFPTNASGRLELARAIASRDNPLTARVFVNRVWLNHFGVGLVRTPGDFGTRSEPPTHPELLDWLAAWFMDSGWSVKKLHRAIMLSSVYQQSSLNEGVAAKRDPDNRLLWRQNRRRLDFESLRDSLLASTGNLDGGVGGRSVDIVAEPLNRQRTVYSFVDRQDLPNLFRVFDFANPDASSAQRFQTTVAQQALFLMNSAMVIERARSLTHSPQFASLTDAGERTRYLYKALYQRAPTRGELELSREFVAHAPAAESVNPEVSAWQYGVARYDEATHTVKGFANFAHFTGERWQGGTAFPDPKWGYAYLGAESGHTAEGGLRRTVVRRWTAPREATISIQGELSHASGGGDGVRGRIVARRAGELGVWIAQSNTVPAMVERLDVRRGDTVDFVVDCRATVDSDTFKWAPVISAMTPGGMGDSMVWEAQKNFADVSKQPKPLEPWEKLAQALLLANEFSFVD
jgi:mono/diheme cytochrome c family protein